MEKTSKTKEELGFIIHFLHCEMENCVLCEAFKEAFESK